MSKPRSDSKWNTFSPEQQQQIEEWLFGQNLSYQETLQRCHDQLGLSWSHGGIRRAYQRLAQQHAIEDAAETLGLSEEMATADGDLGKLRPSIVKMLATRLLRKAMLDDSVRDIAVYGRLLMQTETRELQRQRVQLAREKYEFKASAAALKALPLLDTFAKEDDVHERARMDKMRFTLFGKHLDPEPPEPSPPANPA